MEYFSFDSRTNQKKVTFTSSNNKVYDSYTKAPSKEVCELKIKSTIAKVVSQPSSLCQVGEIILFVLMSNAALLCSHFSFNWSQQTISFDLACMSALIALYRIQSNLTQAPLKIWYKSASKSIQCVHLPNEWLICELTCDCGLLSLSTPWPALAHGLLVYQAAEAIKLMPFINTLLSDAAMLPAADEIYSSCA